MPVANFEDIKRGALHLRFIRPAQPSRAGVLFLPSAAGLAPAVDKLLSQLAEAGFVALAWDPFASYPAELSREERGRISESEMKDSEAIREHRACVDFMHRELGLANVGTLGFCMGGRMGLLLAAADSRIKAAAAFYPTMRDPKPAVANDLPPVAGNIACPVQIHYPGLDLLTSHASLGRLRVALESRQGSAATIVYNHPKAKHGFLGKTREESPDDFAAGLISWPATLAFFRATLAEG